MGPAPRAAESKVPLHCQYCIGSNGYQSTGGEPESRRNCKRCAVALTVALTVTFLGLVSAVSVLAVLRLKLPSDDPGPPVCPDEWVGYRRKCYYFSDTEGNWTYSQSHCSSLSASLAGIDSEQEKAFLLRYKGVHDHWIGLRREQGQQWKWANGTEFNHLFVIRGGGDCAYLNDGNGVSSSRCYIERQWICSKPDVYVMGKGTALEGSSNKSEDLSGSNQSSGGRFITSSLDAINRLPSALPSTQYST